MSNTIAQPIACELERYEELFASCLKHKDGLLDTALRHLAQRRGKQMRPKLMLLCAKACGTVTPAVLHAAVAVELLHTASLVHDDIVDESDRRRGQKSVNALIDNKAAVLVGDYLLSTALCEAAATGDVRVNGRLAWLGQQLAEGELMQLDCTRADKVCEEDYREVIRRKTASLFAVSAQLGAMLAESAGGVCPAFTADDAFMLGESIGMAFQMRDDMFDYHAAEVGKPTAGADLREGKLTLPAIRAVQLSPALLPLALKIRAREATEAEMETMRTESLRLGMDYTAQAMAAETMRAMQLAGKTSAEVRQAIEAYVQLVGERKM